MSGSNPISLARFSRVSLMSSTIRIRIFSPSATQRSPIEHLASLADDLDEPGGFKRERDQAAEAERDPVRHRRFHDARHGVRWRAIGRPGEPPPRDDEDGDDASEERAVDRGDEQKAESA